MIDRRHWLMHLGALGALGGSVPVGAREAARGAPMVRPGQPLRFPRDFGAHPEFRTEWWYITGQLGRELGFQITFFRSRVDTAQDNPSRLAARQLILAHAALTDVRAGQLLHEQRVAREGLGLAGAALDDTHVHLRSWSLQRSGTATQSLYQARIEAQEFRLLLDLRATQALLLQGDAGYSRKGPLPTQASHYYSQPQLAVTGQLTLGGQARPVTGRAWMDHEWSESLLAPDAVGWDWIGMNLHDGTALTAFQVRRADGSIRWVG
ncbi:MAG TPA: carotenoid 1,2-hydratase, partial [Aquabacterium sp.]|nr:carotenoid 1,2-hydratase [Aquabacterium sp.]